MRRNFLVLQLGLFALLVVCLIGLHTLKEVLAAARGLNMFYSHMKAFGDDPCTDTFVNFHTQSAGCHVPNTTSLAVVKLVGQARLDSSVANNIDVVSNAVARKVGGQVDVMPTERAGKQSASARTKSV